MNKTSSPSKGLPHALSADVFPELDARFARFANFKTEQGKFATLVYGHAGKPKVLCYDLAMLVKRGAFVTALSAKGTIFTMDKAVWHALGMYFSIAASIAALVYFLTSPSDFDYSKLESVSNYLNMFIPFILGLYVSLALQRWWMLRTNGIGKVMDATQNLALIVSALLPGKEFQEWHDQVLKYSLASITLIVQTVRGKDNIEQLGPEQENLLTSEEVALLLDMPIRPRPSVMWAWTCACATKVMEEQGVPPGKQRDVVGECVKARDGISLIWTYLGTQLPFAYVHLVTFLVNLNNVVMAIKCGVVFASSLRERNYIHAVSQIVFVTVVPLLYQGLLSVSYVIHDPFGEDLLDFPVMAYQEYTNEAASTLSHYTHRCPALLKEYGPPPSARALALRKGHGRQAAERAAASVSDQPVQQVEQGPPAKNVGQDAGDDTDAEVVDSPLLVSLREQARVKDELITSLQEQNQLLESGVTQVNNRLRTLEHSLLRLGPPPPPPMAPNCCILPVFGKDRIVETVPRSSN